MVGLFKFLEFFTEILINIDEFDEGWRVEWEMRGDLIVLCNISEGSLVSRLTTQTKIFVINQFARPLRLDSGPGWLDTSVIERSLFNNIYWLLQPIQKCFVSEIGCFPDWFPVLQWGDYPHLLPFLPARPKGFLDWLGLGNVSIVIELAAIMDRTRPTCGWGCDLMRLL